MLQVVVIVEPEQWNHETEEFVPAKTKILKLEHSLVSISKWESKWCKSFFSKKEKTDEETMDYIKCMTLNRNLDPKIYDLLTNKNIDQINEYIIAPMTATCFNDNQKGGSRETITSELIYYWMIALNIPPEYQNWHINRLITLIRVCQVKNSPPKKMSRSELNRRNRSLNAARKAQLNTRG